MANEIKLFYTVVAAGLFFIVIGLFELRRENRHK